MSGKDQEENLLEPVGSDLLEDVCEVFRPYVKDIREKKLSLEDVPEDIRSEVKDELSYSYVSNIINQKLSFSDVPEDIREEVKSELIREYTLELRGLRVVREGVYLEEGALWNRSEAFQRALLEEVPEEIRSEVKREINAHFGKIAGYAKDTKEENLSDLLKNVYEEFRPYVKDIREKTLSLEDVPEDIRSEVKDELSYSYVSNIINQKRSFSDVPEDIREEVKKGLIREYTLEFRGLSIDGEEGALWNRSEAFQRALLEEVPKEIRSEVKREINAHAEKIRAYIIDLAEERLALEEIPEEIRDEVKLPYYVQQLETGAWLNGRDGLVVSLENLSEKLRADRSTVLAAVKLDGNQLKFASDELQGDREVVSAAIWQEDKADVFREFGALPLDFFEKGYWSRRSWEEEYDPDWHERNIHCGDAIAYASDTIRSDPNAVEEAFKAYLLDKCHEDSTCKALNPLQFANDDILGSSDFLLEAAAIVSAPQEYFSLDDPGPTRDQQTYPYDVVAIGNCCEEVFQYASEKLAADKSFILEAIKIDAFVLQHASEGLQADRTVVLAAVEKNGHALKYAAETLRSDRTVVLAAVEKNGHALKYAAETLKNDRTVVLAAVRQNGGALEYAPKDLRADQEVVLTAVRQNGDALEHASKGLRNDVNIRIQAWRSENEAAILLLGLPAMVTVALFLFGWKTAALVIMLAGALLALAFTLWLGSFYKDFKWMMLWLILAICFLSEILTHVF